MLAFDAQPRTMYTLRNQPASKMAKRMSRLCLLLLGMLLPFGVNGEIGPDGLCALSVFTRFTTNNGRQAAVGLLTSPNTNVGHSQLAAAIMAVGQFNHRDSSVVPELANLGDCNVQVDLEKSVLIDSGASDFGAAQALFRAAEKPCAIIGPYSDAIATQLGVLAMAGEIPHVVSRSFSMDVTSDRINPFTSSVYPDLLTSASKVASYLEFKGRNESVAIMYSLSDVGAQRFEALNAELRERKISNDGFSFAEGVNEFDDSELFPAIGALRDIRRRGFRTIVFCLDAPRMSLQAIADAIDELDMNDGDYFFVFHDRLEPNAYLDGMNENVTDFLKGSAWVLSVPQFHFDYSLPFGASWLRQGNDTVDMLNELFPIKDENSPGFISTQYDFFQTTEAEYGAGYMYDAVMAALIGACHAEKSEDGSIAGKQHQEAIRKVNFTGATGTVAFGSDSRDRGGTRLEETVSWVAVNFVENGNFTIPDFVLPGGRWNSSETIDFLFADSSRSPPPLRAPTKANHLSKGLRIFGFTLMSIAIGSGLLSATWVFLFRKHRVVAASQPEFLYLICFGAIVQSSSILTISFDESYGWTKDQLDRACMAMPWLLSLGFILVYSAIFTKLWRVNKVLQFTRRKVTVLAVGAPMFLLLLGAIGILVLWTVLDPLTWERDEINTFTGESVGTCESNHVEAFVAPLVAIILLPTFMTGFMAYKTKDVDEQYTEGWWLFTMITIHVQIIFVTTPVIIILNDISTSGRYLGFLLMMWSFPMSTLSLIFVPKMITHLYAVRGWDTESGSPKRGERGNSRVSGLKESHSANNENHHNQAAVFSLTNSKPALSGTFQHAGSTTLAQQDPSTLLESSVTSPTLAAMGDKMQSVDEIDESVGDDEVQEAKSNSSGSENGETAAKSESLENGETAAL